MTKRDEVETDYCGESSLAGWIVGWSGVDYPFKTQSPKIRIRPGPIEIRLSFPATYIVASIAITEDGATIHHVVLNPKDRAPT